MKKLDGDGTEKRERACESGWCVCDNLRKVPTVGHLGDVELVTVPVTSPEMPDGWNFPSAITRLPHSHAFGIMASESYYSVTMSSNLDQGYEIRDTSTPSIMFKCITFPAVVLVPPYAKFNFHIKKTSKKKKPLTLLSSSNSSSTTSSSTTAAAAATGTNAE
jgi:hypothetical protein